ncbi:hypothetical protein D3C84_827460 [compost metagenome]
MPFVNPRGVEGRIQCFTTHCVVDNIEALPGRMLGYILFNRHLAIIDKGSAETLDDRLVPSRTRGKHLGSKCPGYLNRNMADTSSTTVNQYLLTRPHPSPVHQAFPCRDQHQWHRRRLAHTQVARFTGQQSRIDRSVFSQ